MRVKPGKAKAKRKTAVGAAATWLSTLPSSRAKAVPGTAAGPAVQGPRRRVWWAPTEDKARSDFAGMFWTATVVKKTNSSYKVVYDNGEVAKVDIEDVFLLPPIAFGEDEHPLQAGEFCEVSNDSESDPAEWLAVIRRPQGASYLVTYPFHDTGDEVIHGHLVRRARIHVDGHWMCLRPGQTWEDGEVVSPLELEHCSEAELLKVLGLAKGAKGTPAKGKETPKATPAKGKATAEPPAEATPSKAAIAKGKDAAKGTPSKAAAKEAAPPGARGADAATRQEAEGIKKRARGRPAKDDEAPSKGKKRAAVAKAAPAPAAGAGAAAADAVASPDWKGAATEIGPGLFLVKPQPDGPSFLVQATRSSEALPAGITLPSAQTASQAAKAPAVCPAAAPAVCPAAAPLESAGAAVAPATDAASAPAGASAEEASAAAAAAAAMVAAAATPGTAQPSSKKKKCTPRKWLTAQEAYSARQRPVVVAANPTATPQALAGMLARLWMQATPEERAAAEQESATDRARYTQEMAKVMAETPKRPKDPNAPKKDPDAPKRPRTAYILFSMDYRKKLEPGIPFNEGTALAAQAFKAATPEELAPYHAASDREKAAYALVSAAYERQKAGTLGEAAAGAPGPSTEAGNGPASTALVDPYMAAAMHRVAMGAPAAAPAADGATPPAAGADPPAQGASAAEAGAAGAPSNPKAAEVDEALRSMDVKQAEAGLAKAGFVPGAFYKLADALRLHSPLIDDALRGYKWYICGRKPGAQDWLGIMVTTFGLDACERLKAPSA
ncbi:hypothetical protein WJX81_000396 [Elliptochloris bilobata]|uniref:HMG box domain-containing protein n=1 Tax=Elliptochloris bilobata TaxID=381761 RepID=A0AAW1RI75_9CHLO